MTLCIATPESSDGSSNPILSNLRTYLWPALLSTASPLSSERHWSNKGHELPAKRLFSCSVTTALCPSASSLLYGQFHQYRVCAAIQAYSTIIWSIREKSSSAGAPAPFKAALKLSVMNVIRVVMRVLLGG